MQTGIVAKSNKTLFMIVSLLVVTALVYPYYAKVFY